MKKVTIRTLQAMKEAGERITMLTAYDATFAKLLDAAGVDTLLVGDSLGMVVQGHSTTLPVTMDQMVYHTAAVTRAVERAHVIGDMPFMSYQASIVEAVHNAGRLVAEGRAEAVKLEGGAEFAETVTAIVRAGIPVMGHIGLTPQSVHKMGGYVVQGKDSEKAQKLFADAVALERAGAYAVVLEGIPMELAEVITRRLRIPTIGIGAGPSCDGQVLVSYDLLGLNPEFQPRFVKRFAELGAIVKEAAQSYASDVKQGKFPDEEHSFRSRTLRLVPTPADTEDDGKTPIYGAPV